MSNHDEDSFKDLTGKEKILTIGAIALLLLLALSFVIGIFLFGFAGLFTVLGVEYATKGSLLIFVIYFFLLGFIFDIFFDAVAKIAVENVSGRFQSILIQISIAVVANWLVLVIIDSFMESINLSQEMKLIIALIVAIVDVTFDDKKVTAKAKK